MPTLFGQRLEPGFDIEKEKRTDRVGWAIFGGLAVAPLYKIFGGRFSVQAFQGLTASVLFYGANFYSQFPNRFRARWPWKALLATIPMHAAYLWALFGLDVALPGVMTKAFFFIPVIGIGFTIESLIADRIVGHFKSA
jgi:hypothetical protein